MNHKKSAFTLLEILLSLFITALLIGVLSTVFNIGLRSYRQGRDLIEITRKAQLILGQMTRELGSAMVQNGTISFNGSAVSVYFMAPYASNDSRIDLCKIGYLYDSRAKEVRRYYADPDEYPNPVNYGQGGRTDLFCSNITAFDLRYRPRDRGWQGAWTAADDNTNKLPALMEVRTTIEGKYGNPPQRKTFTTCVYLQNSE